MINLLKNRLADHSPNLHTDVFSHRRAAVAIICRESPCQQDIEVLMMLRAERNGDPWSGHMSFPGGKMEQQDANSLVTAQRETHEEIGIAPSLYNPCIGRLSDLQAGHRTPRKRIMRISPYVFVASEPLEFITNHEVQEVVWVPLSLFKDANQRQFMNWVFNEEEITLPYFMYYQYKIWGLSLMMIEELVKLVE